MLKSARHTMAQQAIAAFAPKSPEFTKEIIMKNVKIIFTTTRIFAHDLVSELLTIGAISAQETKQKGEDKAEVVAEFDDTVEVADVIAALAESGITNIPYTVE